MDPVYLDHNATTPLDPRVAEEISRVALAFPGNPESPHSLGRAARNSLEESRESIAASLGARPDEIAILSGGTESDNLAILGGARAARERGRHLVTTAVEHPAVLGSMDLLEEEGYEVTRLPVDAEGMPSVEEFEASLRPDTVLASVMLANNETGAIYPIPEMAARARERGVLFHTDAVQAIGKVPVNARELGVDLLSSAAHKLYGPRGIGLLFVRDGNVPLVPLLRGGHHEKGLRPGTSLTALAAGYAEALSLAVGELGARKARMQALSDRILEGVEAKIDDVKLNGPRENRLPNTVNVTIRGVGGEALLIALDREGFCIATGSACASGSALPSHVLRAMGMPDEEVSSSIRLTVGATTTEDEVGRFLEILPRVVDRLRAISHP
ncbi:MAG: cysteine desulfurase family protein [Planctomycetota bacterium]